MLDRPHDPAGKVLTDADKEEILSRAEKGQSGGRIAVAIGRHPATVNWFMYCNGFKRRSAQKLRGPYNRGGVTVYPWQPSEDAMMERLAGEGLKPAQIAAAMSESLGREVKPHSVKVRLVMLASFAEAAHA